MPDIFFLFKLPCSTLCMHKGIMIERNVLENSLILEKKETYFLLKCPPYLLKKKLKCGTLDGLKAHLCSLIMLLPGMPKNLLCKEEFNYSWLPELQASLSLIVRKLLCGKI